MKAVFIVLTKSEQVADVMERLVEIGVKGATAVSSRGMSGYLGEVSRVFGRIRHLTGSGEIDNHTIFSVVDDSIISQVLDIVDEVTGGLDSDGVGIAFSIPVEEFRG